MKKFIIVTLSLASLSALASEDYFNFPTIRKDFGSNSEACASWFKEKSDKYGDKVLASESGCKTIQKREHGSGSIKAPQYRKSVEGSVVLDVL